MMNFLSPVLLLSCGVTTTTNAFSVISSSFVTVKHHQPYQPLFVSFQRSSPSMVVLHESVTEEIETVTNTATPTDSDNDNTNVYSKIGITKNDLAIGIDPEEVLEWIGTREDMIVKVMTDIPTFDRDRAELEVTKYLKDPEVVNYHIGLQKRIAEDPDLLTQMQAAAENGDGGNDQGFDFFQALFTVYITYVSGNIAYKSFLYEYVDLSFIPGYTIRQAVETVAGST